MAIDCAEIDFINLGGVIQNGDSFTLNQYAFFDHFVLQEAILGNDVSGFLPYMRYRDVYNLVNLIANTVTVPFNSFASIDWLNIYEIQRGNSAVGSFENRCLELLSELFPVSTSQLLLDEVPGAAFAASVRLLRADYSGGLARVIAYDGATQFGAADIMPYKIGDEYWIDLNSTLENLDATAIARGLTTSDTLADLCSVGVNNYDGLATKHYNQVSSNDMEVATLSSMPRIVNAGVLEVENGKPKLARVNNATGMLSTFNPNAGTLQKSMLIVGQNSDAMVNIFGSENGGLDYGYVGEQGSTANVNFNITVTNERRNGASWSYSTRDDVYNNLLNQSIITNQIQFNFDSNSLCYGYRFSGKFSIRMLNQQEMVIWEGTPNQNTIETNANNAYSTF